MINPVKDETKDKRINVLFVIVQMKMGGSEHLVLDLIRNLDRTRFSPHLAWFYEETPLPQFKDLKIPLFHIPKIKRFDFGTMRQLSNIIGKYKIDIVNAHHFLSMVYSFYGCKLANNIGLVYTEHSVWEIQKISTKWKIAGKFLLKYTDSVIGISEKVSNGLSDLFALDTNKTHSITNGVDCTLFSITKDKKKHKERYSLGNNELVIGMVANLKNNKNHIFLLKAFRNLLKSHNNLRLLFVGQSFTGDPEESETEIKDFISQENLSEKVDLLGERDDISHLLKAMDIFCLTSYQEGLPISLIEAMASGLPVIGTDVAGIQDVIVPAENGFLVVLNDEQNLTDTLLKLIEDSGLRKNLGLKGREIASQKYDFDDCIQQYQNQFDKFSAKN